MSVSVDSIKLAPSVVPKEKRGRRSIDNLIEQVDNLIAFEKELIEEYGERIEE